MDIQVLKKVTVIKVLILTYYFPPCNFTAASRPLSWFKYLYDFGYYPVVITVDWSIEVLDAKVHNSVRVDTYDHGEIYYVSPTRTLRQRLIDYGVTGHVIGKIATFFDLLISSFTTKFTPYANIFNLANNYLIINPDANLLIASANPYPLFSIASRLAEKHPSLKWVADYRDDWSTKTLNKKYSLAYFIINKADAVSEKKWLASSSCFISVSDLLIKRISNAINKPGYLVSNGYFEEDYPECFANIESSSFVISYSGMLYLEQDVEAFILVLIECIIKYQSKIQIKLRFIGSISYPYTLDRLVKSMSGYESYLEVIQLVSREKCISLEAEADLLLMMAYGAEKGIPSSKLYQYIGHGIPIFVYPGDDDIIDNIVSEQTFLGRRLENHVSAVNYLCELIERKINGESLKSKSAELNTLLFSRRYQTEKLAEILNLVVQGRTLE